MDHIITFAAFVVSKCVFVCVCIYIFTWEGEHRARAVRPWGWSEGQGHTPCAEGLSGLPETQSSGEKFIFMYLEIRCISAAFDLADSWPCILLKLLN